MIALLAGGGSTFPDPQPTATLFPPLNIRPDGELAAKSGVIDFSQWTRVHYHDRTSWARLRRWALMADVESQIEGEMSKAIMSTKPVMARLDEGATLIQQGEPVGPICLILDGTLRVDVDGDSVAELGPGAIVG